MFDILNPTVDMIDIRDIAHAGSNLCRFTGHTKYHYSIAQHEWSGSHIIPREYALEFLLHDAAESYVNDMSRPLKHMTECGDHYRPVEEKIQAVIRLKFGLPAVQSPIIHKYDNMMLMAEKRQLMGKAVWSTEEMRMCNVDPENEAHVLIQRMTPEIAETLYLEQFRRLQ
jgi:5'-deoxynucleotidase YfbR-like HD superfamily hydrolase